VTGYDHHRDIGQRRVHFERAACSARGEIGRCTEAGEHHERGSIREDVELPAERSDHLAQIRGAMWPIVISTRRATRRTAPEHRRSEFGPPHAREHEAHHASLRRRQ
jgi:hypothetical protein